jgi:hypothetical protein
VAEGIFSGIFPDKVTGYLVIFVIDNVPTPQTRIDVIPSLHHYVALPGGPYEVVKVTWTPTSAAETDCIIDLEGSDS